MGQSLETQHDWWWWSSSELNQDWDSEILVVLVSYEIDVFFSNQESFTNLHANQDEERRDDCRKRWKTQNSKKCSVISKIAKEQ